MRLKMVFKLTVDIFMTLALLFLMGYQFWGEAPHEWVGTGMFLLFIAHHILNINWYRHLFQGKYSAMRIGMLWVDILVLISMLVQMYSGIAMSRHIFTFLPSVGGMAWTRRLHILGAYWGFLFVSLHLGLHWNQILRILQKKFPMNQISKIGCALLSKIGILIAGYGVFAFIKRDFFTYLFLSNEFVFLNYEESKILFYMDYLAIMGLCILISHYGSKISGRLCKSRRK